MAGQLVRPVVALIATTPREEFLNKVSLPSIAWQTHPPVAVVLVADQRPLSLKDRQSIQALLGNIPLVCLQNKHLPGAAGSWNTGIDYICAHFAKSYIAILDDDDTWEHNHLSLCLAHSANGNPDIVLSGIQVVKAGEVVARNIPDNICVDDFLVGNPGWQGSNTFIATDTAYKVGGFSNGLISSNDRDFAIRVLSLPNMKVSYTGIATVNWACGHHADALSAPGSSQKRRGCAQFLQRHGHRMSAQQKQQYFDRMAQLFQLPEHAILAELEQLI